MAVSPKKHLGAYFTPIFVASWLADWSIRHSDDRVLDPSFGDGVFLEAAANRLLHLGGNPRAQVSGCEIDPASHGDALFRLKSQRYSRPQQLHCGDFFEYEPTSKTRVDVLIGNPPYIRYQRFNGDARKKAIASAAKAGVHLNQLTSSWAPFLVHACQFLKPGGRLAMVLPFEVTYANYARPVLDHLLSLFSSVDILTFRQRIFTDISEDTVLLLAEGFGSSCARFEVVSYDGLEELTAQHPFARTQVNIETWRRGEFRLAKAFLPEDIQELYTDLSSHPSVARLGRLGRVDIGYVSGNKDFFQVTNETVDTFGLPRKSLRPAILNSRDLQGLSFTQQDFQIGLAAGKASWLFYPDRNPKAHSPTESAYIASGVHKNVQAAYKCRTRSPWWFVPFVCQCDAVLTVMSSLTPRLVLNEIGAVVTNSLLMVRFNDSLNLDRNRQAAAFYTTLTQLSAEIEGHGMGGGALKLEPSEAEQLLLVSGTALEGLTEAQLQEIDSALRSGDQDGAAALGDRYVLQEALGVSEHEVARLREGVRVLRQRRRGK